MDHELRALANAARPDRLCALFVLLMSTGLRISEALGMKWSDFDETAGLIHVTKQLQHEDGSWELKRLKTRGSVRSVEVGSAVVRTLKEHRTAMAVEEMKLGPSWKNNLDLIFTGTFGQPLDRHNVLRRNWKGVLKRSGVKWRLGLHDLRTVFATTALSKGMPITTVSAMLGHKDASTTLRLYAAAVPQSGRAVAQAMDDVIGAGV